ncbi:MAG TPA: hypothetical protein VGG74_12290 [Kofleriaceae bacterium]
MRSQIDSEANAERAAAPQAVRSQIDELWRRCVEQRDDDDARGVLADLLQANGDARGELMALQLLPADPDNAPARRARIRELIVEYAHVWLGPLREYANGASFERGMVKRLELVATQPVAIADDRELWSVEELVGGWGANEIATLRRVLASPGARSVRRLEVFDTAQVAVIVECPQPIEHLACMQRFDGTNAVVTNRFMTIAGERETIVSVAVWADGLAELQRRTWFDRLANVTLACGMRRGLALWPEIPSHMSLTIATTPSLDTCARAFPGDCRLELRRDGTARVSGEWLLQSLDVLDALPADITRLELEDTSEPIIERIRVALGARREIVLRGLIGRAGNVRWK